MSSSDAEDPSAGSDGARFRFGGARLGRYELLGELGVGGMARVCLAKAVGEGGFERLVAVKLLHEHLANEQEFIAMFLDEARLAARIRHPNVVSTLDVQSESGKRYLVMDYVEGPALSALISTLKREGKPMPLEIALRIQLDVLSGLHAAHELKDEAGQLVGLVHRDISPHNVLVGKDGVARITDFGVARAEMRLSSTRSGELKGKVPYMAPEQIVNEPVDRRADVYAAALVLWEMLAQRRLLVADNQGALLQRIVGGAYEPAAPHHPEVFPELDELLARAMDKDLASRIGSAAQFADALEEVAHAAGVRIASTRAVAAFVVQHTPAGPSVRALPRALAGSSSTSSGVVTLTAPLEGAPSPGGPAAAEDAPITGTTGGTSLAEPGHRPPGWSLHKALAVVAAVAIGVGVTYATWRAASGPSSASQSAPQPSLGATGATLAATASQTDAEPAAPPSSAGTAPVEPAASSAELAGSADAVPSPSARPTQTEPWRPAPVTSSRTTPRSAADFVPGDL